MVKLLGAVLVAAGAAAIGYTAVERLRARTAALRALADALELMERELCFRLTPMPELFADLAGRVLPPVDQFFQQCAEGLDELPRHTLGELWQSAAAKSLSALHRSDLKVLLPLGAVLGRYSGEEQRQAIAQTADELRRTLLAAEGEQRQRGKVYGALSAAAGALLVILLL